MAFEITSASNLLPLNATRNNPNAFNKLTPADAKVYTANANKWVDQFRAEHPDGKLVVVEVDRLNTIAGDDGRVSIILVPNDDLNTTAISFPVSVADAIARRLEMPSFKFLGRQIAFCPDTTRIEVLTHAVKEGETYTKSNGDVATYKCPGITLGDVKFLLPKSITDKMLRLTEDLDAQEYAGVGIFAPQAAAPAPAAPVAPVATVDTDIMP